MTSVASGAALRIVARSCSIGPRRSSGRVPRYSSTVVGSGMNESSHGQPQSRCEGDGGPRGSRYEGEVMDTKAHDDGDVEPAESRAWDRAFRIFFATTPHRLLSSYSKRSSKSPIEQIVTTGRRTGKERRHNVSVYDIGGAMYVGHPN